MDHLNKNVSERQRTMNLVQHNIEISYQNQYRANVREEKIREAKH